MEKKDERLTHDEIMEMMKQGDSNDLWWITILLLVLGTSFPSYSSKTEVELAELKGKVSVIENLLTKEK